MRVEREEYRGAAPKEKDRHRLKAVPGGGLREVRPGARGAMSPGAAPISAGKRDK